MRKKRLLIIALSILIPSIVVASILIHQGQEPSNGEVPEVPADTTPSPSDTSTPEPTVPPSTSSTLTMLSITEGDVFVMKAGTDSWIEAQVGMSLEVGDTVKSGDSSNAEITFFDGSTIELQAGTEIEVASLDISTDTGSTTISLKQTIGTTISRVTKLVDPASSYEIETLAGVAAVRGSTVIVQVIFGDVNYEDGTTWITNQEGNIYAIAQGVELQIPEGRKCIIISGQPPRLISLVRPGGGRSEPIVTDLAINKSDSSDPVDPGNNITYTLQITNNGPSDSTGAVVVDALPSGVSFVSATDGGTYDSGSHTVSWSIGALANNASTSFNITVKVNESTTSEILINTATVDANEQDRYPANNTATEDTTINVNDPPLAEDDAAITDEDTPITVAAPGVLNNDSDPDVGDTLTVTAVDTSGTVGAVTAWDVDGSFTYDPDGQFEYLQAGSSTTDSFTYTVSDDYGGTDTATVTITINGVNLPPVAANDSAITDEDTLLTVAASGVLNNDSDPDVGDTLTVTAVDTSGTVGTVTAYADGSFTYDPDGQFEYLQARSSTTDSFTYTVSDDHGGTDTATVTITINGVNDAPTGISLDNTSVAENKPPGTAVGNFSTTDPDTGDTFTYSLVSGDGDNDNASFTIADSQLQTVASFDYETNNSYSIRVRTTDSGTIYYEQAFSITVINANDPPVAVNDIATTVEDTPVTIYVLNNDFDDNGDTLTVYSVTQGTDGSVINNGSYVTYTPYLGFSGTDSFTYTISDGNGGTDTATVTVIVNVNIIETPARINIQIDTGPTASIFIWDSTTNHWAIDEDNHKLVNGDNHATSDTITVAGGHYYRVWVEAPHAVYYVKSCPSKWTITPAGDGEAAGGYAGPGSLYSVHFTTE